MGNANSRSNPPPPEEARLPIDEDSGHFTDCDLNSYEAACADDPDLQSFDSNLRAKTTHFISKFAVGVEVHALSVDSLKEITACLLEMNQEVVKVILNCQTDIWKTQELFDLVQEYFENSLQTLDFLSALDRCLKRARDNQLLILLALQQFDQEEAEVKDSRSDGKDHHDGNNRYARTLKELSKFKEAKDPFTEEFFAIFQSVYSHQMATLAKLRSRKNKLDKKMRSIHAWRKVSSVIFAATVTGVLICSVVAAAVAAPPVAAALAAAASLPIGSAGKWMDSLLKKYESMVGGQREVGNTMEVGTQLAISDLENIKALVEKLQIEIEAMVWRADFAITEEAVKLGVAEMRKKLTDFMKSVDDLGTQADNCGRNIRRARTVVLQRIIRNPNTD